MSEEAEPAVGTASPSHPDKRREAETRIAQTAKRRIDAIIKSRATGRKERDFYAACLRSIVPVVKGVTVNVAGVSVCPAGGLVWMGSVSVIVVPWPKPGD